MCESLYCQAALWYMLHGILVAATGPLPLLLNNNNNNNDRLTAFNPGQPG